MWGEFCNVFSPIAEEEREEKKALLDSLIASQKSIIEEADKDSIIENSEQVILNKALIILEKIKERL